ncbi:unnamed protein product [Allacma fusca]|uniref:Uncharacterized protein n=1 Tax=Allacma fusca TaxID=39272 RepID=A0A8J2J316_9HEXA|nr:unnamed protein product [Allacma fusca]
MSKIFQSPSLFSFEKNFDQKRFSIVGTIRVLPELLDLLSQPDGLKLSVCYPLNEHSNAWEFCLQIVQMIVGMIFMNKLNGRKIENKLNGRKIENKLNGRKIENKLNGRKIESKQ